MVNTSTTGKNIWVASSDGDLARVKHLIEIEGISPNAKDHYSYTPMHAAASYAHIELLAYLVTVGGDVHVVDEEGDTPLFTVENEEVGRWLIEHGADPEWKNAEEQTAADVLDEDHPTIASYLRSLTSSTLPPSTHSHDPPIPQMSQHALESYTSTQTSALMEESQRIIAQAEAEGVDPDDRLREMVERAVRQGVSFGQAQGAVEADEEGQDEKRTRTGGV